MICRDDRHENSPGTLSCCVCGGKLSALAQGDGLPYPWWKLEDPPEIIETALSLSALARDSRTGQIYSVREYYPGSSPVLPLHENPRSRNFISAAKSLRGVAVPSMRVMFPYTSAAHWYTVSPQLLGTPLQGSVSKDHCSESEVRKWFRAILAAVDSIHKETIDIGRLYHGDVKLANVLLQEPGTGYRVQLVNSIYLEQFLTETQLPPEHFIERDLRGAGLAAMTLLDGKHPAGDPSQRLDAIRDVVLGATLDYLFRAVDKTPGTAEQLIHFLDGMSRAESQESKELYQAAYQVSGSARLRLILNAAPVTPQRPVRATPVSTPQIPPVRPTANPPSPAQPVAPSEPPSKPAALPARTTSFATHLARFVKTAMLIFIMSAAAVVLGVVLLIRSFFSPEAPKPPRIIAEPSLIHRGQNSLLQWTAKGFSRVELNGQAVTPSGSRSVSPSASTSYRLTVKDSTGKIQSVETRVDVIPPQHAPRKPKPALENGQPYGIRQPSAPGAVSAARK